MNQNNWNLIYEKNNLPEVNAQKNISIACVLAYFNGKKYIKEQIESIVYQDLEKINLNIFISDDNSDDNFLDLTYLEPVQIINLKIFYRKLKVNLGYAHNFLYSLRDVPKKFDYYCFSDQDDIWNKNKVSYSINKIKSLQNSLPIIFCGRTTYFNKDCTKKLGNSIEFKKEPSFRNAIIQNIAGGNTMVFNYEAMDLIVSSIKENINFVSHDWWSYLIVTGAGGIIHYEKIPLLKYRQHKTNLQGSNNSLINRFKRIAY